MQAPLRFGRVLSYDSDAGLGTVRADGPDAEGDAAGEGWTFHCTAIADGSRENRFIHNLKNIGGM